MNTLISNIHVSTGAQVRLIISSNNWLESLAVDQLKKTAELAGVCYAAGMPDLHPGKGQPIGAAFISRGLIYPHLVGSDIGCGMGLWQLNITKSQLKLDRLEKKLTGLDELWSGDYDQWLADRDINTEEQELRFANAKLGTIGGGNHFAEIQRVKQVFAADSFAASGLTKQSTVLLVHSGSRGLGQTILQQHIEANQAQGLPIQGDAANHYLLRHHYAVRWAEANRQLIAQRFCDCLHVSGKQVLDIAHNTLLPLTNEQADHLGLIADNVDGYWIHRKGVSPTDQGLVMIPGSRGSLSYLVRPKIEAPEQLAQGGYSLAHGAGRKWKRTDAKGRLEGRYKVQDLTVTALGSRVICKAKDLLYEEAPQAYKNIDRVVNDLVAAGMIELVASFQPLITYKTRRR